MVDYDKIYNEVMTTPQSQSAPEIEPIQVNKPDYNEIYNHIMNEKTPEEVRQQNIKKNTDTVNPPPETTVPGTLKTWRKEVLPSMVSDISSALELPKQPDHPSILQAMEIQNPYKRKTDQNQLEQATQEWDRHISEPLANFLVDNSPLGMMTRIAKGIFDIAEQKWPRTKEYTTSREQLNSLRTLAEIPSATAKEIINFVTNPIKLVEAWAFGKTLGAVSKAPYIKELINTPM
jgi:hypothetical protein